MNQEEALAFLDCLGIDRNGKTPEQLEQAIRDSDWYKAQVKTIMDFDAEGRAEIEAFLREAG